MKKNYVLICILASSLFDAQAADRKAKKEVTDLARNRTQLDAIEGRRDEVVEQVKEELKQIQSGCFAGKKLAKRHRQRAFASAAAFEPATMIAHMIAIMHKDMAGQFAALNARLTTIGANYDTLTARVTALERSSLSPLSPASSVPISPALSSHPSTPSPVRFTGRVTPPSQ